MKNKTVKQTVFEMLTENTGIALCDSGGDNGRMWQRNKSKTIEDFEKEPTVTWDYEFETGATISLFHYLERGLELDTLCHTFNRKFVPTKDWDSEEFYGVSAAGEEWIKEQGFDVDRTFNSYNGDSMLSQIIQGTWLELDGTHYLLLQIHGGADARGGYTDARLFLVNGFEDGALSEDIYGSVTKKDGTVIEVDNRDTGYSLMTGDGKEVTIEKGDKVELVLSEVY